MKELEFEEKKLNHKRLQCLKMASVSFSYSFGESKSHSQNRLKEWRNSGNYVRFSREPKNQNCKSCTYKEAVD